MSNPDIIVNQNIISQQEIPGFKYLPPEEAAFETKPQEKRPPDPLEIRIASMEMITSNALSRIPRLTIHTLSADIPIETKEAELVKNEAGNPQRALSYLNYLLRNPEAADLLSRLHPQREYDTGALIKLTDDWKSATIQAFKTPRKPLPERIVDQADKQQYLCAVVPLRPGLNQALEYFKKATRQSQIFMFASRTTGLDQTDELVEDWARYTHRGELSGLSQKGAEAIESAAEIALSLSDGNPSMRKETIESIKSVIQAQDKWSVVAEDGLDPLTQNLLSLLVKNHEPEAVTIILDTLRRRIIQDENFTASMLFPSDEFMLHAEITLKPTIDWCLNLALQTDKQAVVKYAGDHLYDRGMAFYLVDLIASRPELHNEPIHLGFNREIEYFGKKFTFSDLPTNTPITLHELTFGKMYAQGPNGEYLGLYLVDPTHLKPAEKEKELHAIAPESVFSWSMAASIPISQEKMAHFVEDFPSLAAEIGSHISPSFSPAVLPLPAYYQLWEYLESVGPTIRPVLNNFLKEFGARAVFSFITGEYGRENIPRVMQFALKSQQPQVYDDDGVTHIRMYESFTESVLKEYADLAFLSWDYAASITPIPEHALQIHELVLQRAKALLLAAARHHEKNGSLTKEDEAYLQAAFDFQKLFLLSLADRTGEFARSINIPYDMVRDFFRFHDPTDADSRAVFNSAMELWFEKYIREQEHAPYKGKVEELTIRFYQEYEELEKDSAQTTADPILEKTRYKASDEYDLARGYMPLEADPEDPYTIGFIGIGNSRMENEIINALKAKTKGYRFIGIDINRPATLLEDVEFHRMNMKNLGREMPGKFNRLYAIWSPYMDVLELEELLDTAESLALACLTQNPVKPSESKTKYPPTVLLDIHFPFGKHSYEETTKKFHQDNPTEPEGMMHKDFEREGKEPVGKRFFASDPVFIDWIFGLYGFDIENLPRDPKEIANLCQQASLDDSFIPQGPQHDLDKQAYYRTASGANRITYKLKGVRLNQSVESIMAIRNEIMKEMKQKATENSSSSRMPT